MTDFEKRILDAVLKKFEPKQKPVELHKLAKELGYSPELVISTCKKLIRAELLTYYNAVLDKTAPKHECVMPTPKAYRQ